MQLAEMTYNSEAPPPSGGNVRVFTGTRRATLGALLIAPMAAAVAVRPAAASRWPAALAEWRACAAVFKRAGAVAAVLPFGPDYDVAEAEMDSRAEEMHAAWERAMATPVTDLHELAEKVELLTADDDVAPHILRHVLADVRRLGGVA